MQEQSKVSKNFIFTMIGTTVGVIILLMVLFVIFYGKPKKVIKQDVDAGRISLTYTDENHELSITNAKVMSDKEGKKLDSADQYFDFTISSTVLDEASLEYEIALVKEKSSCNIPDDNLHVYLEHQKSGSYVKVSEPMAFQGQTKKSDFGSPKGAMSLAKVVRKKDANDNYRLRMWMSGNLPQTGEYHCTIQVFAYAKAK